MIWRRSRPDGGAAPAVGGDVSGIVNTGDHAVIVQVTAPARPSRVLTHRQLLLGLHGRSTYLREEELPFVGPGPDHEADPANLFARLAGPDGRGVLVVGRAGAGKTRTCFEVAARADAAGWRVLHVPASPVVTVEDLTEDVLGADDRRVLLVVDYLDACPQLDLRALAGGFLADARRSGIEVACIASARPGSVPGLDQRGADWLFDQVSLRGDQAHDAAVADHIVRAVAPAAVRRWGGPAMARACGRRPIIALLIARMLELRLVGRETAPDTVPAQTAPDTVPARAAQLRPWLRDALRHDRLTGAGATGGGPLDMSAPTVQELACAVAVAACPQPRDAVESAVDAFLTAHGPSPYSGRQTVEALLSLGWLDEVPDQLVAVHDTVTDELLLQSMLPPPGRSVHQASAESLLAAVSARGGSFALFTEHLRRIVTDLSAPARRSEAVALERFCREWTGRHRDRLGTLLAGAGKDGERALLTMVLHEPWRAAVRESWPQVGAPWLRWAEPALQATLFLAAALRSAAAPDVVVAEALSWLERRCGQTDADRVIRALLTRADLTPGQRRLVLDHAMSWIRDHPGWPAAPEMVLGLLQCAATRPERLEAAGSALAWLTPYRGPDAATVVRRLLEHDDWPPEIRAALLDRALAWVRRNDRDGGPVLANLVQSATPQERPALRDAGLLWLQRHPAAPNRTFLVHVLLAGEDVQGPLEVLWSGLHSAADADVDPVVVHQLLESRSITAEQVRPVIERAFRWLSGTTDPESRRLVLTAVMGRAELTAGQSRRLAGEAMRLLDETADPRYLTALLHRGTFLDDRQTRRVIALTVAHCRARPGVKQQRLLLNALLRRRDLTGDEAREVVATALEQARTDHGMNAGKVLSSLIERDDLTPAELDEVLPIVLRWLEEHRQGSLVFFLLRDLLHRGDLPAPAAAACERLGRDWLATAHAAGFPAEQIRARIPYPGGETRVSARRPPG